MNQYSQNFIISRQLISRLVRDTNITKDDTVLDIGAGEGNITRILSKKAKKVIGIESDISVFSRLESELKGYRNVDIYNIDVNKFVYPKYKFKVFSNIPFNQTSNILKGLLDSRYFMEGYIIMQLDAVFRYTGEYTNSDNTLLSSFYGAMYKFNIFHRFSDDDFTPTPRYKCVMLRIERKKKELIPYENYSKYRDYISYIFNTPKGIQKIISRKMMHKLINELGYNKDLKPSLISIQQHVDLFNHILKYTPDSLLITKGSYTKYSLTEKKNTKIYRTRRDITWREK